MARADLSLRRTSALPGCCTNATAVIEKNWRKRVRVELTLDGANPPSAGFEDREDHRTPCASMFLFSHGGKCRLKAQPRWPPFFARTQSLLQHAGKTAPQCCPSA